MQALDDKELAGKAAAGDRAAFEALVTRHYDRIYRFACKWCGRPADAEDIAQDVAIKLARAVRSYDGRAAFTSWLYRLTVNAAIDWQRAQGRHAAAGEDGMINIPADGTDAQAQLETRQALAAVDALPEKEKTAVLLVFGEGLSHAEAAATMDVKESTVSWYIHEARKKLGVKDARSTA